MAMLTLIARILAVVVAIVGALTSAIPEQTTILLVLGAIAGIDVPEDRRVALMLATLVLFISGEALNEFIAIGSYLGQIFGNLSDAYLGASLVVVLMALAPRLKP